MIIATMIQKLCERVHNLAVQTNYLAFLVVDTTCYLVSILYAASNYLHPRQDASPGISYS
jgi:hypothetical protein